MLSVVPILAGSAHVVELSSRAESTPAYVGFFASPAWVIADLVSASLYSVLGAFQFSAGLRRRRRGWHRAAEASPIHDDTPTPHLPLT